MKVQNTVDILTVYTITLIKYTNYTNCIFSSHNLIFVQDWMERKDSCVYAFGCARTKSHKGWIVSAVMMEKNAADCENAEIM